MAQEHKRVTVNATGGELNIYVNLYFHFFALVSRQSAAVSSVTQNAMPAVFGGKWKTECFNTRFLSTQSIYKRDTA